VDALTYNVSLFAWAALHGRAGKNIEYIMSHDLALQRGRGLGASELPPCSTKESKTMVLHHWIVVLCSAVDDIAA
jgi:hypothetical protein